MLIIIRQTKLNYVMAKKSFDDNCKDLRVNVNTRIKELTPEQCFLLRCTIIDCIELLNKQLSNLKYSLQITARE